MELKQSLLDLFEDRIIGAEDDDDTGTTPNGQGDPDPNGEPDSTGSSTEDDDEEDDDTPPEGEDGRTKALKAERKLRREAQKRNQQLEADLLAAQQKDMDELTLTKSKLTKAEAGTADLQAKLTRMAEGARRSALTAAIVAEATKQGFLDTSDAIAGVDATEIDVDQDEDDPTDVTVDLKAVTRAVKKLATSKPHYIKTGTSDGNPTGSSFGGSRHNGKGDEESELRSRYPAL